MNILINVRSGIVTALIEVIILLFFAPIVTRGTAIIYNLLTTRRVLSGKLVRIYDNSLSVEDLLPRTFRLVRTASRRYDKDPVLHGTVDGDVYRQSTSLLISLIMTSGFVLISTFTDGKTIDHYESQSLFVWNGGKFVDTTSSGVDLRAGPILGMAGVRSACVDRINTTTFNLHAVGFFEKQDFKFGGSANRSLCLNGRETREKIGVSVSTNKLFNPTSLEYMSKDDMEGGPANFEFKEYIRREGTPDYCRVRVTTQRKQEDWTFSDQDAYQTRFATRATRDKSNVITLKVGVAYRYLDALEADDSSTYTECESLNTTHFAPDRFTANITEIGISQNLSQLELVVADMLRDLSYGYGRIESQEIMMHSYYAGANNIDEILDQSFGTFDVRKIEIHLGERKVTEISTPAVAGIILTVIGTVLLLVVMLVVKPQVRITSVSYVSRLYSGERVSQEYPNDGLGEVEYIGMAVDSDGSVNATPVPGYRKMFAEWSDFRS